MIDPIVIDRGEIPRLLSIKAVATAWTEALSLSTLANELSRLSFC